MTALQSTMAAADISPRSRATMRDTFIVLLLALVVTALSDSRLSVLWGQHGSSRPPPVPLWQPSTQSRSRRVPSPPPSPSQPGPTPQKSAAEAAAAAKLSAAVGALAGEADAIDQTVVHKETPVNVEVKAESVLDSVADRAAAAERVRAMMEKAEIRVEAKSTISEVGPKATTKLPPAPGWSPTNRGHSGWPPGILNINTPLGPDGTPIPLAPGEKPVYVNAPPGTKAGDTITTNLPDGRILRMTVPDDVDPKRTKIVYSIPPLAPKARAPPPHPPPPPRPRPQPRPPPLHGKVRTSPSPTIIRAPSTPAPNLDFLVARLKTEVAHLVNETSTLARASTKLEKSSAMESLQNLTQSPDGQRLIVAAGAIPPLVELIKLGATDLPEAVEVLMNLALNAKVKVAIAESGTIPALIELVISGSDEHKRFAAGVLQNLAVEADNRETIVAGGAVPPLVELARTGTLFKLGDHSLGSRDFAVAALGNLARDYPKNAKAIVKAGAIAPIVEMLSLSKSTECPTGKCYAMYMERATRALESIADSHIPSRVIIGRLGAIPRLVEFMRTGSEDGKAHAAGLLSLLATTSINAAAIEEAGASPLFIELLKSPVGKKQAQSALRNLAKQEKLNAEGERIKKIGLDFVAQHPEMFGASLHAEMRGAAAKGPKQAPGPKQAAGKKPKAMPKGIRMRTSRQIREILDVLGITYGESDSADELKQIAFREDAVARYEKKYPDKKRRVRNRIY